MLRPQSGRVEGMFGSTVRNSGVATPRTALHTPCFRQQLTLSHMVLGSCGRSSSKKTLQLRSRSSA